MKKIKTTKKEVIEMGKKYRQGDVMLKPVSKIPAGAKEKDLVLVEGEVTGHSHRFVDLNAVSVYEVDGKQYVEVIDAADLVHEEHDTHKIPAGKYEVVRQREEDLTNVVRRVMD